MSINCPRCISVYKQSERGTPIIRIGSFVRASDKVRVQRFLCKKCSRSFSHATTNICKYQKKRNVNSLVFELLVSGVSQRRVASLLKINRKTVIRKFLLIGQYSKQLLLEHNQAFPKSNIIEFDDMETFQHTKCKPLSITIAVESGTRRILGYRVADIPARGTLAEISRKKYGKRKDQRSITRKELFTEIAPLVSEKFGTEIKSDQNPHYSFDVRKYFPNAYHVAYKGQRGCVVGYGELKKIAFDPLFSLNHTCAMLRDNINRLKRKTWATTKLKERLDLHIGMYCLYHNLKLI